MRLRQKQPRVKLEPKEYTLIRKRVLERDGWRCRDCGSVNKLQVHHLKPRSGLGSDTMTNLITLCALCLMPSNQTTLDAFAAGTSEV
jgi:5-methylcytosine-specific restriction endonuclease McrA